jgi:hypothetical protein
MATTSTTTTTRIPNKRKDNRLKTYVRYDGNGKIVPGGNILARNKPKVGKWEEGPANICCNPTITTTTTVDRNPN